MHLEFDPEDLQRLIAPIVAEVLGQTDQAQQRLGNGRLAYSEAEAAGLLGIARHSLRDSRLRGELVGTKIGNRIFYEHAELLSYLARQRLTR